MVEFTAISERFGEEGTYALIQPIYELMAGAVRDQGGSVKDFTGDGIMALFGVPNSLEDAPLRACRAGLLINERLAAAGPAIEARHGVRPQMRIGINTGRAVVTQIRSESANMTALGDTVNLASRLQTRAEPGTVLLSEATNRLVRGMAEMNFAGTYAIKGKADPQKVYRLGSIRQGVTRFEAAVGRGLSAYVGRARELDILERGLVEARGQLHVIDVMAEPGAGKSRLLYEFRSRIDKERAFVLSGSCSPDGQQTPFLPFIEVVRGSFQISAGEAEKEVARKLEMGLTVLGLHSLQNLGLLTNLLGLKPPEEALVGLDGVLIGLRTRELLQQLLKTRCHISPVTLLIEDLHWIDGVSEEVLARIVEGETKLRLLLIHTRRPEYVPAWLDRHMVAVLHLEPLPAGDIRRLVQARLGVEVLPEALARLVTEKAEGNALFAEEITSYLLERGMIRQTAAGLSYDPSSSAAATLPGSVRSLLTARADRLGPADKSLLQVASVIGRRFDPDLLAAMIGAESGVVARLDAMQAQDLIHLDRVTGDYAFKHALVRDALYDSLLTEQRRALHGNAAQEIERRSGNRLSEMAELLAYHYGETESVAKAFVYLALAGKKALGTYSLDEAERYLEAALKLLEGTPSCTDDKGFADMLADLTSVLVWKLLPKKLIALTDRHMERLYALEDLPQSVIVLSNYVLAAMEGSRWPEMLKHAEYSLVLAERIGDDRSKAFGRANWILARCLMGLSSHEEADRQIGFAISESTQVDDGHLHFLVLWSCAWDRFQRGLTGPGRAFGRELQKRGERTGDPRALSAGAWIAAWFDVVEDRHDDLIAHAQESHRAAVTQQDFEMSELLIAMAMTFRGEVAEGAVRLQKVRERCIDAGWSYITSATDMPLGIAMILQGNLAAGIKSLEVLVEHNDRLGFVVGRDMTRILIAETYIAILQSTELPPLSVVIKNLPFLIATRLSGWKKAEGLLLAARDNVMSHPEGHWRARAEANLGFLYAMKRRHNEARSCFTRARPIAERLGPDALLAKIDAAIAKLPAG
jgi:class 3 adenylate cyclase